MKNVILFLLILGISFSFSISFEYPYLYRDYRALGMGNAFNAVGGSFSSVFYNPAGLTNLKEEEGFYVNLLPITVSANNNAFNVINDVRRAINSKDETQIFNTIKKYRGEVIHAYLSIFPSLALKKGSTAFGFGVLLSGKLNGVLHHGGGSEGLFELENIAYGSPIVGFSYDRKNISFGGSLKYIIASGINNTFRISEVTSPNFDLGNYIKYGSDFSLDLGVLYKFESRGNIYPQIGLSLMNITNIYVKDVIYIPMTANVGLSLRSSSDSGILREWTIGADYVDIFMAFEDKDILKRIRVGAEGKILSGKAGSIVLRGGIYGGQLTAGVEFNLLIFTIAYTTYAEELGARAFQNGDRRHILYINAGW